MNQALKPENGEAPEFAILDGTLWVSRKGFEFCLGPVKLARDAMMDHLRHVESEGDAIA